MNIEIGIVIIWAFLQIPLVIWSLRARPPEEITSKYTKKVLFQIKVPFLKNWQDNIHSSDKKVFEEYRRRFFVQFFGGVVIPLSLIFVYLFLKTLYLDQRF